MQAHPDDFVQVLETRSVAELTVAESILADAEIPYWKRGDALQDMARMGRALFGMAPKKGHLSLHVPREYEETARELLSPPP